jgi:hypothetical protein
MMTHSNFLLFYIIFHFELWFYMYCIILPLIWPNLLAYFFQELCLFCMQIQVYLQFCNNKTFVFHVVLKFSQCLHVLMYFNFTICQLVCGTFTFIYISWFIISWFYYHYFFFCFFTFLLYSLYILYSFILICIYFIYLCPLYMYIFLCCVKRVVLRRAHSLCLYLVLIPYL